MFKSLILILSFLLSYISCKCKFGFFTDASPCDTEASLIQSKRYATATIAPGGWAYFYLPLGGIDDNIQLYFEADGPYPYGFLNFQRNNDDTLPTNTNSYYSFQVKDGDQAVPSPLQAIGSQNLNKAIMVLGLKNRDSSNVDVKILYYAMDEDNDDDENRALRKLIVGIIIGVAVAAGLLFCIGGYSMWLIKRMSRRNALAPQNGDRVHVVVQRQNNKDEDHLSLEDLQKYFPKKPFESFENPFQQTGCSVCLEDFLPEVSCHQLYCNHIFHEACVEKWLEKHNNCPGCRVPIGKKAIEEFLEKQKKQDEGKAMSIEIKIQSREVVHG